MSIEDVLEQQTQMIKMLKGVANAVAELQTQVPGSTSSMVEKKAPYNSEVTHYGMSQDEIAVATPVPTEMSQDEVALAAAKQDTSEMSQYEAALPAAKENPSYMAALSKVDNNEPLTPEEQQAYDKVKGIEAFLQTAQQKGGRRKRTKKGS